MTKIYETLRKKNDNSVEVYPNIEARNIPNNAVSYAKLDTSIQGAYDKFYMLYDPDDNKIRNVNDIDVIDDITASNITLSNRVKSDVVETNSLFVNNKEITQKYTHIIQARLHESINDVEHMLKFNIESSSDTPISDFETLLTELKRYEGVIVFIPTLDYIGVIEDSDVNEEKLYVYTNNTGSGSLTNENEYDSLVSILDNVM